MGRYSAPMPRKSPRARPEGWTPPGPRPAGAQGRPELEPGPDEELVALGGDFRVFQHRGGHKWTTDDLLTAAVADAELEHLPGRQHLDLGCGTGSVFLLLAWKRPDLRCVAVERQAARAALARRSVAWNGVEARCAVLEGDLRDAALLPAATTVDLITGTPPYFPPGTGTEPGEEHAAASRFEHHGGVEDYLAAADRWLAPQGRLVLCAPPLLDARLHHPRLFRRRVLEVTPREGKAVLLHVSVFERSPGPLEHQAICLRTAEGALTPALRELRAAFGFPPAR